MDPRARIGAAQLRFVWRCWRRVLGRERGGGAGKDAVSAAAVAGGNRRVSLPRRAPKNALRRALGETHESVDGVVRRPPASRRAARALARPAWEFAAEAARRGAVGRGRSGHPHSSGAAGPGRGAYQAVSNTTATAH